MGAPPLPGLGSHTFADTTIGAGIVPSAEQEAGSCLLVSVSGAGGQGLGEAGSLLVRQHRIGIAILLGI